MRRRSRAFVGLVTDLTALAHRHYHDIYARCPQCEQMVAVPSPLALPLAQEAKITWLKRPTRTGTQPALRLAKSTKSTRPSRPEASYAGTRSARFATGCRSVGTAVSPRHHPRCRGYWNRRLRRRPRRRPVRRLQIHGELRLDLRRAGRNSSRRGERELGRVGAACQRQYRLVVLAAAHDGVLAGRRSEPSVVGCRWSFSAWRRSRPPRVPSHAARPHSPVTSSVSR